MNDHTSIYLDKSAIKSPTVTKFDNIGYRLNARRILHARLTLVSDINSFLALLSIILMIIANELTFDRKDDAQTVANWLLRLFITIITVILLTLIIFYHRLDLKLYAKKNALKHHFLALTNTKIIIILIELIVCSIHPIVRSYPRFDPPKLTDTTADPYAYSHTPVDIALSLPMFLRLYLFGRSILYHSRLVCDASLHSFGYLNRVSINFFFLIKTYLDRRPLRSLLMFCTLAFLIGSWSLRACDYQDTDRKHFSMSDTMWLFVITFTTVGYGDIYPSSYCGRTIAAMVGLIGLLSSALLIAVLTRKLILSREEKYVHTFVLNTELERQRKFHAANTIKFAIKLWYLQKRGKSKFVQLIPTQRKLFQAISQLQQVNEQRKKLINICVGFHELLIGQQNMTSQHDNTAQQIIEIKQNMKNMETQLNHLTYNMIMVQKTLTNLVDDMKMTHTFRL